MKRVCLIFLMSGFYFFDLSAQVKGIRSINGSLISNQLPNLLSDEDIFDGLLEMLLYASNAAIQSASKFNGFNNNSDIKIYFPKESKKIKKILIKAGMNNHVVAFEEKLNRTAEIAAKEALPILENAVRSLTISNVIDIKNGSSNEATLYLKEKSYLKIYNKIIPIIKKKVSETNVLDYWDLLQKKYNMLPFTKPVNQDIEEYITEMTIEGIFVLIAAKEKEIRKNPKITSSVLLQELFKK
ncbi:MAG: hypothetical protein CMD06_01550 [Flavobacteriales bacterium]|nr:hypothetical protein [Flavobacteriales bacterium]